MSTRTVVFLLVALTLLAIALSTGGAVYYLLFWMLMMMFAIAFETALATLLTIRVETAAQRTRAVRGETVAIRMNIRRMTVLPVGPVELEVSSPMDDRSVGKITINLPPLKDKEYRYSMNCPHRGRYQLGVSRVRVSDVFGLFSFSRKVGSGNTTVAVAPRTDSVPAMAIEPGDTGPQGQVRVSEDMSSPSGVRPWKDGDHLKKVHWKLTMRRRELMVRTYEESARPDTLVLMDVSPVTASRSHVLTIEDSMCDAAASAVLAQMNAGYPVRMPLASKVPSEISGQFPGEIGRFLEALTDLNFDSPYSFEQVLTLEMRRVQRTGGVLLVTPRLNSVIADYAMRMRRLGVRVQLNWVAESVTPESLTLKAQLELNGIPVRQISPWG